MQKLNKSLFYTFFGNLYEHYSSSLLNFTLPFFSILFFPDDSWMSYYAVAGGFLLQPFGAVIFSWVGDRFGRRPAILWSFFLSTVPMFCIGLLPTYAVVGLAAPIMFILCRIFQGAGVGGAFYGTLTFVNEVSSPYMRNLNMGIIVSMGFLGVIMGMLMFRWVTSYNVDWAWRIPFLVGGLMGFILYAIRRLMVESKVWEEAVFEKKPKVPFLDALRQHPANVVAVFCVGMGALIPFYTVASWLPSVLIGKGLDSLKILNSSILMMGLGAVGVILACWSCSFINIRKILWMHTLVWIPLGVFLYVGLQDMNPSMIRSAQFLIALNTGIGCAALLLIQNLFPTRYAYSGFAVPYSFGQALLIGPTPLLADFIARSTGRIEYASILILLCPILMAIMLYLAKPVTEDDA